MFIHQLKISDFVRFGEMFDLCLADIKPATEDKSYATFKVVLDEDFCPTFIATNYSCIGYGEYEGFDLTDEFICFMKVINPNYKTTLGTLNI